MTGHALAAVLGLGLSLPSSTLDQVRSEALAADIAGAVQVPGAEWTMLGPAKEATYIEGTTVVVMRDLHDRRWLVADADAKQSCIADANSGDTAGGHISAFWNERRGVGVFRMASTGSFARAMQAFARLADSPAGFGASAEPPLFGQACELRAVADNVFATWRGLSGNATAQAADGATLHAFAVVTAATSHAFRVVFGAPESAPVLRTIAQQAATTLEAGALGQVAFIGPTSLWSVDGAMVFCTLETDVLTCCPLMRSADAAAFVATLDDPTRDSLFGPAVDFTSHTQFVASMFRAAASPEWTTWGALSLCRR